MMHHKAIRFVLMIALLLSLTTCNKDHMLDCFKSNGEEVTHVRYATGFSRIEIDNNVDLVIHTDTTPFIRVSAGINMIDGIITEIKGNTLFIRNENKCNWVRSFKHQYVVEAGTDTIKEILHLGSGNITSADTILTDEFFYESYNASGSVNFLFNCPKSWIKNIIGRVDVTAKGKSGVSYVYMNDTGILNASGLETGYTFIKNYSTGDCKVYVTKEIFAELRNVGNIYYSGTPYLVDEKREGEGKLIRN